MTFQFKKYVGKKPLRVNIDFKMGIIYIGSNTFLS